MLTIEELAKSLNNSFLYSELYPSDIVPSKICVRVLGKLFKYELHPDDNMENVTIFVCNKDARGKFIVSMSKPLGDDIQKLAMEIIKYEM